MKINSIEIIHLKLPVIKSFRVSFGTVSEKDTILVKMDADGYIGYGEGAALQDPLYVPEYSDETYAILKKYLVPLVLGKDFGTPEELVAAYASIRGHNFAKTALECAFWDCYSQKLGKPLADILGGTRTEIEAGESLGIRESIEEVLDEVALRLAEGYKRIKIKIEPGKDVKVIDAVRKKFGDIKLMADGNSAYTLAHIETLKALDSYDLTMIEQPLAYDDIVDHATLQKQIKTPVCLDESILSAEDARKAIEIGACKIINIKPGRVGGLVESKKIHDVCQKHGVGVWCGGVLETCIGRFFNISIASLPNYIYPADMSPSALFFREDLVDSPFEVKDGLIQVPPHLSDFRVSEALISKYASHRETFSA